ncbi:MAG: hypothetical protein K6F34_00025 [Lachnospiraceae bacterium]|nr:hypothetical protein [Lachnospiraceae bacterium]
MSGYLITAVPLAAVSIVILAASRDPGVFSCVRWLASCLILAVIARAFLSFVTLDLPDGGFTFSLGTAIAVGFMTVWILCTVFGIPFNTPICVTIPILYAAMAILIKKRWANRKSHTPGNSGTIKCRDGYRRFIPGFCIFAFLFIIAFWVKGFKPGIDHQTEQYMDYGFMKAMYRQQSLPFEDMWFAGKTVNYYYLGQAVAVFLCRIACVTPDEGYNLVLCTVFAFLAFSVFSLTYSVLKSIRGTKEAGCITGGIMAAVMCVLGGNGHWIVFGIMERLKEKLLYGAAITRYWFPKSTLFIGAATIDPDKAKHEFPAYTLILGDLHAHVINLIFVMTLLIVLADYAVKEKEKDRYRELFDVRIILVSILLGLFKGINFWDFPIYYVVAGAVIMFSDIRKYKAGAGTFAAVMIKGLMIYAIGMFLMIPFYSGYKNPTGGLHLCTTHSPVYKLVIIWFPHVIMAVSLLIFIFLNRNKDTLNMPVTAAFTMCGLGLLLMPEIIYVKDIYGDEYQRYNTMFKLTFQGFVILSIAGGICIGIFLSRRYLKLLGLIYCFTAVTLGAYMGCSVKEWFGDIFDVEKRQGISATAFIDEDDSYDNVREAIAIINSDLSRHVRILEEAGNSYSPESRLSVFTGAPTVAGWYVHEWVWRNDSSSVKKRHDEVRYFYECGDERICRRIADKYGIDYVYVGPKTNERYNVDPGGFKDMGECVWKNDDGTCMLIRLKDG